ncbi:EamA family transporter [Maritimibacter sp. 55A14]|nr:EamA family transporter [Maritimibacter sp. 55A14]
MTGAVISFTSMAVAGREVSLDLDTFEIMLYRSLIGFVLVLAIASAAGTLRQVTTARLHLHVLRNIFHFIGQNLWFFAVATIPLAQVFALEFSQPIWVALAAPFFLAERLTRVRILAAGLGFLGILLVARPGAVPLEFGTVAAMLAAFAFAATAICTKKLTSGATTTCILFWLTAVQLVLGLACAGIDGDIALPSLQMLPWVVIIAVAGLFAHFCLTTALGFAPAVVVMPLDFLRLPLVAILGMALYAEPLAPLVFLGAAVIFGANYLNILTETRLIRDRP